MLKWRIMARIFAGAETRRPAQLPVLVCHPMVRRPIVFTRGGARSRVIAIAERVLLAEVPMLHFVVSFSFLFSIFRFNLHNTFSQYPLIFFIVFFTTKPFSSPCEGDPEPRAKSTLERGDATSSPHKAEGICNLDAEDKSKSTRDHGDAIPAQTARASALSRKFNYTFNLCRSQLSPHRTFSHTHNISLLLHSLPLPPPSRRRAWGERGQVY